MHMFKLLVLQAWAAAAAVGANGDGGAIVEPSQYHRELQTCGDAILACNDEQEFSGGVGCYACSLGEPCSLITVSPVLYHASADCFSVYENSNNWFALD